MVVGTSKFFRISQAFSLVQMLISLTLIGGLAVVTVFVLKRQQQEVGQEVKRTESSINLKTFNHRLIADLSAAVRTSGSTSFSSPGISADPSWDDEFLKLLINWKPHLVAPVSFDEQSLQIVLHKDSVAPRVYDFLSLGIKKKLLIRVASSTSVNVFQVEEVQEDDNSIRFSFSVDGQSQDFSRFGALAFLSELKSSLRLNLLKRVSYQIESGKVIRVEEGAGPRPILDGIEKIDVQFSFMNRRAGQSRLYIPSQRLASVLDDWYLAEYAREKREDPQLKPVGWQDIDAVFFEIHQSDDRGSTLLKIRPEAFAFGLGQASDQGDELGCTLADKCNSDCSFMFTDENRSSPRWKGYGDTSGPFCLCGQADPDTGEFISPDSPAGRQSFQDWDASLIGSSYEERLIQCSLAYDACSDEGRWLQSVYPLSKVVCHCMQDKKEFYEKQDAAASSYERMSFQKDALVTTLVDSAENPGGSDRLKIRCKKWRTCRNQANRYGLKRASDMKGIGVQFTEKCECLNYDVDEMGLPTTQEIQASQKNWLRLCSKHPSNHCKETLDYDDSRSADEKALYKLRSETNPQGFPTLEALNYCECLDEHPSPESQDRLGGAAVDFRSSAAAPLADPFFDGVLIDGKPAVDELKYGVLESSESQVEKFIGEAGAVVEGSGSRSACDVSQCNVLGRGLGCCTSESVARSMASQSDLIRPGLSSSLVSYCSSSCQLKQSVSVGGEQVDVLERLRSFLVNGEGDTSTLPVACGGSESGRGERGI